MLNTVSEAWRHPAEGFSRYPKLFQCNGKYFFDVNSMIDCSFIDDYQGRYALGTGTQPHHYFFWVLSSLLNATFSVSVSTIDCPHSITLKIIDIIDVKILLNWKEDFHLVLFSDICSNPICKFFPLDPVIIGKWGFHYFLIGMKPYIVS